MHVASENSPITTSACHKSYIVMRADHRNVKSHPCAKFRFFFSLSECPELSIIYRYRKRPQLPVLITASVLGAHLCNLESAAHHAERKVSIMVPRPLIIEF